MKLFFGGINMNKKNLKNLCALALVFGTVFPLHSNFEAKFSINDKANINYTIENGNKNDKIIKDNIYYAVDPDVSEHH